MAVIKKQQQNNDFWKDNALESGVRARCLDVSEEDQSLALISEIRLSPGQHCREMRGGGGAGGENDDT